MTVLDLLRGQALDPFRWALLAGLVATMLRTEAATGRWLPLGAGAAFVAALIPLTTEARTPAPFALAVATGLAVNLAALGVILGLLALWRRR